MAFTIEEIEKELLKDNPYDSNFLEKARANEKYALFTDYLTGKTSTLPSIQFDYDLYDFRALVKLLQHIEQPSPNDQLILDLVYHPDLQQYLQHYFLYWLNSYMLSHHTDAALQAALAHYQQQGFSANDTFTNILFSIHADNNDFTDLKGTPLYEYLLTNVSRRPQLVKPNSAARYSNWSWLYFTLLEEVKPLLAEAYVLETISMREGSVICELMSYKDGQYGHVLYNAVKEASSFKNVNAEAIFEAAVRIYESDRTIYAPLLIELSRKYIDHYLSGALEYYSYHFSFDEPDEPEFLYLSVKSLAFYFLLKHDRPAGIERVEQCLQSKYKLDETFLHLLYFVLQQDALPYLLKALTQDTWGFEYMKAAIQLLAQHFEPATYLPAVWNIVTSKSKPMRQLAAKTLSEKDPEAEAKAITLLEHKKTEARQTAAAILTYFDSAAAREAIFKVLNKEANDNTRDVLLESVANSLPKEADAAFIQSMVEAARNRGKLEKPLESWLLETQLPTLYYTSGESLDADTTRFVLYRMSRIKGMRSDIEARLILTRIDKERSAPFAKEIIKLFIEKNTKPEYKYLLALAALIGTDEIVDKVRATINGWIEENRTKMAEYGIGALALQGSNKALRWVEWYSRKYRSRKAAVGIAATAALEAAAEELDITPYELGDRIVPDFGFEGLFKEFTVNGENYRAFIDSNFKMAFFDEDNKKLKTLPAAADAELKEEFKAIGKEVRDVVKSQSLRLEHYLVVQRRWNAEQWHAFFLNNPIMFIYATKLVWGIYDSNNKLQQCFLCQEDTTLINLEDDEVDIPDNATVGIVHPLQLNDKLLQQWKQKFFDLAIDPVFPQLDRPVVHLADEDKQKAIIRQFHDKQTEPGSIKSTLDKHGWRKGPGMDAGMITYYFKDDPALHLMAIVETEGIFAAGYDSDMDPKLGNVYFIDSTKQKPGWFNEAENDSDERLIPLHKVPEVFYSEVMAGISAIKEKQKDQD